MERASLAAAYFCCCLRASLALRAGPRTCRADGMPRDDGQDWVGWLEALW